MNITWHITRIWTTEFTAICTITTTMYKLFIGAVFSLALAAPSQIILNRARRLDYGGSTAAPVLPGAGGGLWGTAPTAGGLVGASTMGSGEAATGVASGDAFRLGAAANLSAASGEAELDAVADAEVEELDLDWCLKGGTRRMRPTVST
jgi:hypothetical protein